MPLRPSDARFSLILVGPRRYLYLIEYQFLENLIIALLDDPIEYYHPHKKSIITQREIGVDVPDFAEALRRALQPGMHRMLELAFG